MIQVPGLRPDGISAHMFGVLASIKPQSCGGLSLGVFSTQRRQGDTCIVPKHSLVLSARIPYGAGKEFEGVQ